MVDEVRKAGGASSIVMFTESIVEGCRCFSAPWNAESLAEYTKELPLGSKIVCMDMFVDGTMLSNSGSQSANNVRVRFVNIKNHSSKWHDVGIAPTVDNMDQRQSEAALRKQRSVVFHRFFFLVIREFARHSHIGTPIDGVMIFPPLNIYVLDQKQERPSFSLKGAGGFADCTPCLMQSRFRIVDGEIVNDQQYTAHSAQLSASNKSTGNELSGGEEVGYSMPEQDDSKNKKKESTRQMKRDILQIQSGGQSLSRRDVIKTLKYQLIVAKANRDGKHGRDPDTRDLVRTAKEYLANTSAHEYPPSVAAIAGLGSAPYRLYRSVGFDKLHAVDLGMLRQLPDDAHQVFANNLAYAGISKSAAISIANQRLLDLPKSARIAKVAPFRQSADEKQSGMSGKIRRDMGPFLWVAVMGIAPNVNPDEEPLLQAMLASDLFQRRVLGTNQHSDCAYRSEADIDQIQQIAFDAGKKIADVLQCSINTKLHRIMYHVSDHLRDFGCLLKGATDDNETLHKDTKAAYLSTNHHVAEIGPQLLSARAKIPVVGDEVQLNTPDEPDELLITKELLHCNASSAPHGTQSNYVLRLPSHDKDANIDTVARYDVLADQMMSCIIGYRSAEMAQVMVNKEWTLVKSARFNASFEWWPEYRCIQTVYCSEIVFKTKNRRDAVKYITKEKAHSGILQAIFAHSSDKNCKVALVRRLEPIEPDPGNTKVVSQYGNNRFVYYRKDDDVHLDCVPVTRLLRLLVLVPDPWTVTKNFGVKQRMHNIPDDPDSRMKLRFFEVAGYKFTSFPEPFC